MTTGAVPECWYALKVFYNKVFQIESLLKPREIEVYIPLRTVERIVRGQKVRRRQPAVASLMFMRTSPTQAEELQKELLGRVMVYADRESRQPIAIPEEQMRRFIQVTSIEDNGMEYLGEPSTEWTTGQRVRVTDGVFKGSEGYNKRIKGNHRLIVAIEGIVAVATSYIPTCFLEPVEE